MFVNRGILTLLNCLKLILLSLCLFACNNNNNAFEVIDTGILADTSFLARPSSYLNWVDDKSVLYYEKIFVGEKSRKFQRNLMLLDIFTGKTQLIFEDIVSYCFNQDRLLIKKKGHKKDKLHHFFSGSLQNLTEHIVVNGEYSIYPKSCRLEFNSSRYGEEYNRYWRDLPNDMGFLDKGQILPPLPRHLNFTFIPHKDATMEDAVYFNVFYDDLLISSYTVFDNKVFFNVLTESNSIDEKGIFYRYGYWFTPPSSLEKKYYKIPDKTRSYVRLYPINYDRAVVRTQIYTNGVFNYALTVSPDAVDDIIIKGKIYPVTVSPNRCVVAFIHANAKKFITSKKRERYTIKYFTVCKSKT